MALTTNVAIGQTGHAALHNEERTAINALQAATGLDLIGSTVYIYVGGLLAGFKQLNSDGSAFNAGTCNYTNDVLTSIVMTNPAKTYTFNYTSGVLTGMTVA